MSDPPRARAAVGGDHPRVPAEDGTFARQFETHRDDVVRLAYLLAGDADEAHDAAAEAFARTFERWRKGKVEHVPGYVRRAVVNEVNGHFRRLSRQRRFEQRRRRDQRGAPASPERAADVDRVRRLLRQLPRRQRIAVVLRYWEDLSEAETAEAMNCPTGTVKSLTSRGLKRLREGLESDRDTGSENAGSELG